MSFLIYDISCLEEICMECHRNSSAYMQRPARITPLLSRRLTQEMVSRLVFDETFNVINKYETMRLIQVLQNQLSDNGLKVECPQKQTVCISSTFRLPPYRGGSWPRPSGRDGLVRALAIYTATCSVTFEGFQLWAIQ